MDMLNGPEFRPPAMEHLGRTLTLFWLLYAVFRSSFDVAVLRSEQMPVPYLRLTLVALLHSAVWAGVSWLLFRACDFAMSRRRRLLRRATFLGAIAGAWALRLFLQAVIVNLLETPPRLDDASMLRSMQRAFGGIGLFTVTLAATAVGMR